MRFVILVALFVYGTLRTSIGGPEEDTKNHGRISSHISSSTPAILRNADLFSFIHYPGISPGSGAVTGEVFEVDEVGLGIADEIEAHPNFYERTLVTVEISGGEQRKVWTYWAPEQMIETGCQIPSGDWFDRDRSDHDGRTLEQALLEDKKKY